MALYPSQREIHTVASWEALRALVLSLIRKTITRYLHTKSNAVTHPKSTDLDDPQQNYQSNDVEWILEEEEDA